MPSKVTGNGSSGSPAETFSSSVIPRCRCASRAPLSQDVLKLCPTCNTACLGTHVRIHAYRSLEALKLGSHSFDFLIASLII